MIKFLIEHPLFIPVAICTSVAYWICYRLIKMWRRRCTDCGSIWVKREHTLERIFRRLFWSTTTGTCRTCGKFTVIKPKHECELSRVGLVWRGIFYKKQFIDELRRNRQGSYVERCRAEKLLFMVRNFNAGKRGELAPKPKFDIPVHSELSPHHKAGSHS